MMGTLRFVLLFSAASLMLACGGVRRTGSPGDAGLITVFQKEDGQVMYFAGPMRLQEEGEKGSIEFDFTVHSNNHQGDSVVMNFTYAHPDLNDFKPGAFSVSAENKQLLKYTGEYELFFKERSKNYLYRYSFTLPFEDWQRWMQDDKPTVALGSRQFRSSRKFRKDQSQIRDLILFPLSQP
jgi:hypothetical protein